MCIDNKIKTIKIINKKRDQQNQKLVFEKNTQTDKLKICQK